MSQLILVGDVGGTNTRLRVCHADDTRAACVLEHIYGDVLPVADSVADFVAKLDQPVAAACLGVAGRVLGGVVRMTNRPGESVSGDALAAALGLPPGRVKVVNDMVAHASGVDYCELATLRPGHPEGEVEGLVMPGTGLGIGFRVFTAHGWVAVPSEGGHLDFGPPVASLDILRDAFHDLMESPLDGRLSWEHVCSGPALPLLYAAVKDPQNASRVVRPKAKEVTRAAVGREGGGDADPGAAREAVRLFLYLLGARAGNLLLETLATRRIVFGGGILAFLHEHEPAVVARDLAAAFDATGPDALRDTLGNTPLLLMREPDSGLVGAAALARELL